MHQKKSWCQTVTELRKESSKRSLEVLCSLFGNGRQAYYKFSKKRFEKEVKEQTVIDAVEEIRFQAPGIGAFKLYTMLCGIFGRKNLPGRDSFFNLLRRKKLMLSPLKSRSTTNSNHRFHKYKNLIKGFTPTAPNSLWVSDITYISLKENVCYLHLVTEAYSHKIIGWCLAPGLHAIYTLEALNRALEQVETGSVEGLIHHSDRGCQHCCNEYVRTLDERHIRISHD